LNKILLLGTYPTRSPFHGGQLRSKAIFELYQNFSDVRYCAIYSSDIYRKAGKYDIAVSGETLARIDDEPYLEDIICGQAISSDQKVRKKFCKLLESFKPDIIQLEQCYAWLGLRELIETTPPLKEKSFIYSSQNVEHAMKQDIYSNLLVPNQTSGHFVDLLLNAEKELAEISRLLIVTSDDDRRAFEKFGTHRIVITPNGIYKKVAKRAVVKYWKNRFKREHINKALVFVGSEHILNLQGFNDLVTDGIGFLPPDARIYVVGGVCDLLSEQVLRNTLQDIVLQNRISLLGKLSEDKLAGLICASDIILLPVTQGGGSNLKTAEAILSGKKIVSTSKALRSFERFAQLSRIAVAEESQAFKSSILQQLNAPEPELNSQRQHEADSVQWSHCLAPLEKAMREIQ